MTAISVKSYTQRHAGPFSPFNLKGKLIVFLDKMQDLCEQI